MWFLWEDSGLLIYNRPDDARLDDDAPAPHQHPSYLDKYAAGMRRVSESPEAFSADYSVPVRIEITGVRGDTHHRPGCVAYSGTAAVGRLPERPCPMGTR